MSTEVPLVVYPTNGERRVVGTAKIDAEKGRIDAKVTDPLLIDVLTPKNCSYSVYKSEDDTIEVAAIIGPAFESIELDRVLKLERRHTTERLLRGDNSRDHILKAKKAVVHYWNTGVPKFGGNKIETSDLYAVWFSFVLGNWKCLISSDAWDDTSYFEVSYTGAKKELYVDHYRKVKNKAYSDQVMELL